MIEPSEDNESAINWKGDDWEGLNIGLRIRGVDGTSISNLTGTATGGAGARQLSDIHPELNNMFKHVRGVGGAGLPRRSSS